MMGTPNKRGPGKKSLEKEKALSVSNSSPLALFLASLLSMLFLLLLPSLSYAYPPIAAEFYGNLTHNSSPVPVGSVVTAYDPDGVLCGSFTVVNEGHFGLLSCDGDDSSTPEDEGALEGDSISFFIDGMPTRFFYNNTWSAASFKFILLDVNYPPSLIIDDEINSTEDMPFYYDVNATDPNNDVLTFSENTTLFDIDPATGIISFTPTNDDVGVYSINFTVTDAFGLSDSRVVSFTVINVNDAPFFDPPLQDQQVYARTPFYYDINATDIDKGDTLTFFDNTSLFNISPETGIINFTPGDELVGNHSIAITVCDDSGAANNCTTASFVLEVLFFNHPPVLSPIGDQVGYVNLRFTLDVNATDEDNDTLTFYTNATFFSINPVTGLIDFVPTEAMIGTHTVMVWVADNYTNVSETFQFAILPELFCGDSLCSTFAGESCATCPSDCGTCPPSTGEEGAAEAGAAEEGEQAEGEEGGESAEGAAGAQQAGAQAAGGGKSSAGGGGAAESKTVTCTLNWTCSEWGPCLYGVQQRTCEDSHNCSQLKSSMRRRGVQVKIIGEAKPPEEQQCELNATCDDGVQNQNETGIDCGGPCPPCIVAPVVKYARMPFVESPAPGCGDGICSYGEDCSCMRDCKSFPSGLFVSFLFFFALISLLLFALNFVLYNANIYKKGRFLVFTRRILLSFAFSVYLLLVFSLYLYLYSSCPPVLKSLLWLPIVMSFLVPWLAYLLLRHFGYVESRKVRRLKAMVNEHRKRLEQLNSLEEELLAEKEKKLSLMVFELFKSNDPLIKSFPRLTLIYNSLVKLVKARASGKRVEVDLAKLTSAAESLLSSVEFKKQAEKNPAAKEILSLLERMLGYWKAKRELEKELASVEASLRAEKQAASRKTKRNK